MNVHSVLIKPASGSCNMRCRYCFYADEMEHREQSSYGLMSEETLEILVRKVLESGGGPYHFAFQGGEPTLAGLDFYRSLIRFVDKYKKDGVAVSYAIQTNGLAIDEEWAEFLSKHHFLVGVSLDGIRDIHDLYRKDAGTRGTFARVMSGIHLLERYGVEFNILTVVTAQSARSIGKIYNFYKKCGFTYQQYIACLDPLEEERGQHQYSLTPEKYEFFLKTLFDYWYQDMKQGNFVYIRYFENLAGILKGCPPETCSMNGFCSVQWVIEADGSAYPCDFYVLDEWRMGNVRTDSFEDMMLNCERSGFIDTSLVPPEDCKKCKWGFLCRGGCRREREPGMDGIQKNYFCESFYHFFEYAVPRLRELL